MRECSHYFTIHEVSCTQLNLEDVFFIYLRYLFSKIHEFLQNVLFFYIIIIMYVTHQEYTSILRLTILNFIRYFVT